MLNYTLRRLAMMIPTIFGILLVSFVVIQFVPGGPVDRMIAQLQGHGAEATSRFSGGGGDMANGANMTAQMTGQSSQYRGSQGLDPEFVKELEALYGFDKPAYERFWIMITNYLHFDLGDSYYRDTKVIDLILEKMPVSISLGLWSTLLIYFISIPLGIKKAVKDGQSFDIWTSAAIFIGYAIPSFLFAILLIILFAGGRYFDVFPLRGIISDNWSTLPWWEQALDYMWHMTLPVCAMVISGFAGLTMLTKNSFLDEIGKQYVLTARAKGLSEKRVLYGHIFRNAMLIVIAGFPAAFMHIFFTGSLLIEVIFSLDGLGLLGYESIINRDYPVVLGTLYIYALIGLVITLIRDIIYVMVDPRINFEASPNA
ncbi:MAG: microcin C ABC transporter permease YejB [Alphaproteobacteria bacterium]|jgi:microcin C transport system permease protein|nr:microcin C ABC transporter permease YejB [Alphaproteobacteria bacterium]MCB1550807.1 microcin C ABC transporter permease YejB [Alphaproteobacteria bacterium]MCB9985117.1 microcin C ABC transporter permease YejB [Micavibrio sp.]HRK97498.1 microcin C ABC transporter permease YejB [Alphaproteobacteria bacterium]